MARRTIQLAKTHLQPYVIRYLITLNKPSNEVEVGVAGRGVCDLNLLQASINEGVEEASLLFDGHRVCEGLITVAQVCREPYWGCPLHLRGPLSVWDVQGCVRLVLLGGIRAGDDYESIVSILRLQNTHSIGMTEVNGVSLILDGGPKQGEHELESFRNFVTWSRVNSQKETWAAVQPKFSRALPPNPAAGHCQNN